MEALGFIELVLREVALYQNAVGLDKPALSTVQPPTEGLLYPVGEQIGLHAATHHVMLPPGSGYLDHHRNLVIGVDRRFGTEGNYCLTAEGSLYGIVTLGNAAHPDPAAVLVANLSHETVQFHRGHYVPGETLPTRLPYDSFWQRVEALAATTPTIENAVSGFLAFVYQPTQQVVEVQKRKTA
jgi:hypothetical protein